jgi:hypothetical protein
MLGGVLRRNVEHNEYVLVFGDQEYFTDSLDDVVETARARFRHLNEMFEDAEKLLAAARPAARQTLLQQAQALHSEKPGTWIETDQNIKMIISTRDVLERLPPFTGGLWWRTHHLVRHLGGQA